MKYPFDKKKSIEISEKLSSYLADSFVLYVKTLNYHWNLLGPEFFMYHRLLEEQYKELSDAIDEIAERIRMLNVMAPGTMKEYLQLSQLSEGKIHRSEKKMIEELAFDHLFLVEQGKKIIIFCQERGDEGSADLLIDRIRAHDKHSWLLRSNLTGKKY